MKEMKLILASGSPRRRELLAALGLEFDVVLYDVEERYPPELDVRRVPAWLAQLKSEACPHALAEGEVLLTADTVVVLDGTILGKPRDRAQAVSMLERLSGQTHSVLTGVCLRTATRRRVFTATTRVTFRTLSACEIEHYVDTCRPFDKAGAYGIQEWIGHVGITRIEGSYNNVVGLPTAKLYMHLQRLLS